MRQKKRNRYLRLLSAVILGAFLTACSAKSEDLTLTNTHPEDDVTLSDIDFQDENQEPTPEDSDASETESEENIQSDTNAKNDIDIYGTAPEDEVQEPTPNEDGFMEIYSAREIISLSDDMIVGQVSLEDILEGNPILYDRVIIDGYVVEWILTDYEDEDNYFAEEGIL